MFQIRHFIQRKKKIFFSLFLHKNICCGYSYEYPQHMFSYRNKKNIILISLLSVAMNMHTNQGPVVQSLVCLTSSLVVKMLTALVIFFFFWFGFYGLFKNISLISSRSFIEGGRKPENPEKNHLTIRKQNLAFPHMTWARLEPQRWET